jgi:hypothetical protein
VCGLATIPDGHTGIGPEGDERQESIDEVDEIGLGRMRWWINTLKAARSRRRQTPRLRASSRRPRDRVVGRSLSLADLSLDAQSPDRPRPLQWFQLQGDAIGDKRDSTRAGSVMLARHQGPTTSLLAVGAGEGGCGGSTR